VNKKWLWIVAVPILLALFSGGTDAVDINRMIFVVGVGIDRADERFSYTFYTAVPTGSDTAVGDNNVLYQSVTLEGDSMAAALRELEQGSSRDISLEHLNCTAVGRSAMDADLSAALDLLLRDTSVRRQCVVMALESEAEDFFASEYSGSIASAASAALERLDDSGSRSSIMTLGRLRTVLEEGSGFCLYILGPGQQSEDVSSSDAHGASALKLHGLAVYNSGGLGGILTREQAELARLFTRGQVSGLITSADENGRKFYYEIIRSDCTRTFTPGQPCAASITLEVECTLIDGSGSDSPPDEAALSEALGSQLEELIRLSRRYGSALTGLGDEARQSARLWYEELDGRWDSIYADTVIDLSVNCILRRDDLS